MVDESHPNIFKALKKIDDENSLTAGKIAKCNANHEAPKPNKKYALRDKAIRNAIKTFDRSTSSTTAATSSTQPEPTYGLSSDDDESSDEESSTQPGPSKRTRASVAKNPQMVLLDAIGNNIRLDNK